MFMTKSQQYQSKCFLIKDFNDHFTSCVDVGQAQRLVTIQDGPLYRVKGFKVSISCSVTGFKGPDEQNFAFSAYRASRPDQEIQIISTDDPGFSYAVYGDRVRSKDISVERKSGSSVIFHINSALLEDTAEIECHTPNTDGVFFGTYSSKTSLYGGCFKCLHK